MVTSRLLNVFLDNALVTKDSFLASVCESFSAADCDGNAFNSFEFLLPVISADLGEHDQSNIGKFTTMTGFALRIIVSNDMSLKTRLAKLCRNFAHLRRAVDIHLNHSIARNLTLVPESECPTDAQAMLSSKLKPYFANQCGEGALCDTCGHVSGVAALDFGRIADLTIQDRDMAEMEHRLCLILAVLYTKSSDLFAKAADNLFVLIRTDALKDESPSLESMYGLTWSWIQFSLASRSQDQGIATPVLRIWLSMLYASSALEFLCSKIGNITYWIPLQKGLSVGTMEQKKTCLSILEESLKLARKHKPHLIMSTSCEAMLTPIGHFEKFITVFRTIVLSRYLNQVQDCLPDLTMIALSGSKAFRSWILTLLSAGLSYGMQDSIRKVLGSWNLTHGVQVFSHVLELHDTIASFLRISFLPWCTLGPHYTGSINVHLGQRPQCHHGEMVSQFLADLISTCPLTVAGEIISTVLTYLQSRIGYIFTYARFYVLDGIFQGARNLGYVLDSQQLKVLLEISSAVGLQDIVRDIWILRCAELATKAPVPAGLQSTLEALKMRAHQIQVVSAPTTEIHASIWNSRFGTANTDPHHGIKRLDATLRSRGVLILAGSGLEQVLAYIIKVLPFTEIDSNTVSMLEFVLQSLWEQMDVQEFPKAALRCGPPIFFHKCVLHASLQSSSLKLLLQLAASTFQRFAQHRIYALSALVPSLRKAFLLVPKAGLPLVKFVLDFCSNPPTTKSEFQLEQIMAAKLSDMVPQRTYESYYGESEPYALACFYDFLTRAVKMDEYKASCKIIIERLIEPWLKPWLEGTPLPVFVPWKSTFQLQTLLILSSGLSERLTRPEQAQLLSDVWRILSMEPLPRYRYLLEWIVASQHLLSRGEDWEPQVLLKLEGMDLANPKQCVSSMKIASVLVTSSTCREEFAWNFMLHLITLAANPKILIRHESQWTIPRLWDQAEARPWRSLLEYQAFSNLNSYIRSLETYRVPPPGRLLEIFNWEEHNTVTNLIGGALFSIEPSEPSRTSRDSMLRVWENDKHDPDLVQVLQKHEPALTLGEAVEDVSLGLSQSLASTKGPVMGNDHFVPLQIKSTSSSAVQLTASETTDSQSKRRVRDMIVVASLVDNAYNLGGISRVCEIFGVAALHIRNINVLKNKDFTSVAVASHLWLPIRQLERDAIASFLTCRKIQGYKIIGIEQTDSSMQLGDASCILPEKIVLVLGGEQDGISAALLAELDFSVEIKQDGVTRSMNVQTAAATVLYEYARQHP